MRKTCICGKMFETGRWIWVKTCSRSCGQLLRFQTKKHPNKGIKFSAEWRQKLRVAHLGQREEKCGAWKGGQRNFRHQEMGRDEYKQWRKAIFERDKYTCVECGISGVYIQADHIKPWSQFPNERYDIQNGRTLCISCHEKTPSFPKQFVRC
jgi:5-methylcytosine-specific restriction endonuclease McrA